MKCPVFRHGRAILIYARAMKCSVLTERVCHRSRALGNAAILDEFASCLDATLVHSLCLPPTLSPLITSLFHPDAVGKDRSLSFVFQTRLLKLHNGDCCLGAFTSNPT
eukprot:3167687-Rhodomonas_salina.3